MDENEKIGDMERIPNYCSVELCFAMDIDIAYLFEKPLVLCTAHAREYKEILEDILLGEDEEWMAEWAEDNLKPETAKKFKI